MTNGAIRVAQALLRVCELERGHQARAEKECGEGRSEQAAEAVSGGIAVGGTVDDFDGQRCEEGGEVVDGQRGSSSSAYVGRGRAIDGSSSRACRHEENDESESGRSPGGVERRGGIYLC